jgi:hypothetical protein
MAGFFAYFREIQLNSFKIFATVDRALALFMATLYLAVNYIENPK